MLGNFVEALRIGSRAVIPVFSRVGSSVVKVFQALSFRKLLRVLPEFGINQQVSCRAQLPVLHKNQECKYVSSKCYNTGLEIMGNYLVYNGKRYPITPLVGPDGGQVINVQGHMLFAINTAGTNHYKDFESKKEENKVLVVAYNGSKCVDPTLGMKGSRRVVLSVERTVYPFSFSIVNYATKETDFLLSFLMLPFNMTGLIVGCAGRLCASLLLVAGKCCNKFADMLSKNIDQQIIHQSSGVLEAKGKPYLTTSLIFLLSVLGDVFSCTSAFVKNSANFLEGVVRFPSAVANGIHNENMKCLPVMAGLSVISQSAKLLFRDITDNGYNFAQSFLLYKARMCSDTTFLRNKLYGKSGFVCQQQDTQLKQETQRDLQGMSAQDFEMLSDVGKYLQEHIIYGTAHDINQVTKNQQGKKTMKSM